MAYLAPAAAASSLRTPIYLTASSRRRSFLPAAVKATASSGHPILSSLRMAASAAVLLAATSPALACTPSAPPPPPTPLTVTVSPDDAIPDADASESHPFEKLIIETACLARIGGAGEARSRLAAAGCGEIYGRLLAAQVLFVDGKVDEAIAAFEELAREDPADYRPLFCQGVLYLVLGREVESESMLERCREVGGDALIVDPAMMVTPTVGAESSEEKPEPEPEPEPAKV
ncbi:unnamed protein product [Miscanthus lutarioriparius]|uniref:Uncharacterized protein n=1 Tax=Miscanthus lutarioriparius TaxID=422564 RepID=A0A811PYE3_9POAL|nr:unnamed protein product [Miscanthus lutarioriparius]